MRRPRHHQLDPHVRLPADPPAGRVRASHQAPAQEEGANARVRATAAAAASAATAAPSGRARCRPCRAVIAKGKTRLEVCASVRPGRHAATRLGHTPRAPALCDRTLRRAWWVGGRAEAFVEGDGRIAASGVTTCLFLGTVVKLVRVKDSSRTKGCSRRSFARALRWWGVVILGSMVRGVSLFGSRQAMRRGAWRVGHGRSQEGERVG